MYSNTSCTLRRQRWSSFQWEYQIHFTANKSNSEFIQCQYHWMWLQLSLQYQMYHLTCLDSYFSMSIIYLYFFIKYINVNNWHECVKNIDLSRNNWHECVKHIDLSRTYFKPNRYQWDHNMEIGNIKKKSEVNELERKFIEAARR